MKGMGKGMWREAAEKKQVKGGTYASCNPTVRSGHCASGGMKPSVGSYHTVITTVNTSTPVHITTVAVASVSRGITSTLGASAPPSSPYCQQQRHCRGGSILIITSLIHANIITTTPAITVSITVIALTSS